MSNLELLLKIFSHRSKEYIERYLAKSTIVNSRDGMILVCNDRYIFFLWGGKRKKKN
jgi:hypothetical protein